MLVLLNLDILLHVFLQQKNWQEYCFVLIFLVLLGLQTYLDHHQKLNMQLFLHFHIGFVLNFVFHQINIILDCLHDCYYYLMI